MNLLNDFRNWFERRLAAVRGETPDRPRIFSDRDGFGIFGNQGNEVAVRWDEVKNILLFQKDCFAVDQVRMTVLLENGIVFGDLNEDMPGWKELTATLPNVLPGCLTVEEWFPKVCRTAFEPNPTTIFRRTTRRSAEVVGTGRD
jgi:hypothetical protein